MVRFDGYLSGDQKAIVRHSPSICTLPQKEIITFLLFPAKIELRNLVTKSPQALNTIGRKKNA